MIFLFPLKITFAARLRPTSSASRSNDLLYGKLRTIASIVFPKACKRKATTSGNIAHSTAKGTAISKSMITPLETCSICNVTEVVELVSRICLSVSSKFTSNTDGVLQENVSHLVRQYDRQLIVIIDHV